MGDFTTHQEKFADTSAAPLSLLDELADGRLRRAMEHAGLGLDDNIDEKVQLFIAAAAELRLVAKHRGTERFSGPAEAAAFWVPGRVEVAGKHTDYAGGKSLLAAVPRGFCVVAMPSLDFSTCRVTTLHQGVPLGDRTVTLDLTEGVSSSAAGTTPSNATVEVATGHWSNYVRVALRRLKRNFPDLRAVDFCIGCDLPVASGMSTSSALICAVFLAVDYVNSLRGRGDFLRSIPDAAALAEYLGCVENGKSYGSLVGDKGVGTFGGSEDHTAIMNCRQGHLLMASFCPTKLLHQVSVPHHLVFVIASSGVTAEKTAAARDHYNKAAEAASNAAHALGAAHLGEALAVRGDSNCRACLSDDFGMLQRFHQFAEETNTIVPQLANAIASGNLHAASDVASCSHTLGKAALRNLVEETAWLPRQAAALFPDNYGNSSSGSSSSASSSSSTSLAIDNSRTPTFGGSSAFGAGFGGSVWALVDAQSSAAFKAAWRQGYLRAFPEHAETAAFFVMRPGPGACRL